jgi:hypothetical protein
MMHVEDRWATAEAMLAQVRRVMHERGLHASRRHISSRVSAMVLPGSTEGASTQAFHLKRPMRKKRSRPSALLGVLGISTVLAVVAAMNGAVPNPHVRTTNSTAAAVASVTTSTAPAGLTTAKNAAFSLEIAVAAATHGIPARSAPPTKPSTIAPRPRDLIDVGY